MSSSFPSMSMALASGEKSSYIRLSPTSFFDAMAASATSSPLLDSVMNGSQTKARVESTSATPLISTPKSHLRKSRINNVSSSSSARKKLCYPDEGVSPVQNKTSVPLRNVSFVPKFIKSKASAMPNESQSRGIYDSFSSTNVYATPPRHSLRRQQSASATLVSVGNGRYLTNNSNNFRSNTAFVRFTPPIGEDVSAIFAGSKFSDSPSAKSLPPPPSKWIEEVAVLSGRASALSLKPSEEDADNKTLKFVHEEEELTSDDTGVVFDLSDGKSSPSNISIDSSSVLGSSEEEHSSKLPKEGLRIHPLQLIAAVMAS